MYQDLLTAFSEVVRCLPKAQLLLVGNGELRKELEERVRSLGLERHVIFTGWREDAAQLLWGIDLLVMPSLTEGFPLVLLEAMADSLPVIANRTGGIPELIRHGQTGRLVEPGNEQQLAEEIVSLLEQPEERVQLGEQGRRRLEENFALQRLVDATDVLYRNLISRIRHSAD